MTSSALTRPGERDRLVVKFGQIDWTLTALLSLITAASVVLLYSIDGGGWAPWAAPHLVVYGLCLVLMVVLAMIDLRVWFALSYPLYGISLLLLMAVMVVGHHALGATRWLSVGHIHFQPSEVMKISLVLALARFYHGLSAKNAKLSWWLLIPAAMIGAPVLLVAKQPDLGTAILLAATGAAVVILAGLSLRLLAVCGAAAIPAGFIFVKFLMKAYQRDRILTFLHPENDPSGSGYHILQAKIALG